MWHISKKQLIFFPLVPFLHHSCHAWPSIAVEDDLSVSTFYKFCQLDKSVIAKQCNCIAAEIVTSHASWSFLFWKFEQQCACNFSLWYGGSFAHIWHDLLDVWVIIWLWWDKHAGHAPSLTALCWNQRWICWRCGCIKGPGQKVILPIITQRNLDNLQWSPTLVNAISVCHVY